MNLATGKAKTNEQALTRLAVLRQASVQIAGAPSDTTANEWQSSGDLALACRLSIFGGSLHGYRMFAAPLGTALEIPACPAKDRSSNPEGTP